MAFGERSHGSRYSREVDGEALLDGLRTQGWVSAKGNLPALQMALASAGVQPTPTQRGRSHGVLRPYTVDEAPPSSMSSVYGLEEQPLHTDGAHLASPPDVIALWSGEPNATPTYVWAASSTYVTAPAYMRSGIFTVRSKRGSFLASALTGNRLRFDPVCMSPADGLAHRSVEFISSLRAEAVAHDWAEPETVLLIDNRRCLHARGAVEEQDTDRRLERATFRMEARA